MRASLALTFLLALLAVPSAARAGDGVAVLPLVAPDAEVVGVINVKAARDASMFQQGIERMVARTGDMETMLAMVGMKLADVDTVVVSGGYGASGTLGHIDRNLTAIIEGGFTKKKMTKTLDGLAGVSTKKKRSVKYWITTDAELAIIGKRLVITQLGLMPGVIDRYKKKAKGFTKSAKAANLRAALAYTNTSHDAWFIGLPPSELAADVRKQIGADMTGLAIGVTLGSSMNLEVRMGVADQTQTDAALAKLQKMIPNLKKLAGAFGMSGIADSLALTSTGTVLDVDATVSAAELDSLLGLTDNL